MAYNHDSLREQQGVSVHTGFPNPATDASLRTLDLNSLLINHTASTYFFRIEGNHWEGSGIFHGDIAIIDRALGARHSDVVVWWDQHTEHFSISVRKDVPQDATVWGVITSTVHQLRKVSA